MCCTCSRRDAEAQPFYPFCTCALCFEALLSQGLDENCVLCFAFYFLCSFCGELSGLLPHRYSNYRAEIIFIAKTNPDSCVLIPASFFSRKDAKPAKAIWVNFTLRLLLSFVSFVVNVLCMFSQRRGGAEVLPVLIYTLCFEALLSQGLGVLAYASPYVFLCDLMWFISRKGAKLAKAAGFLCLFCVLLSAALSQRLCELIHAPPFAFFCFFCGECAV